MDLPYITIFKYSYWKVWVLIWREFSRKNCSPVNKKKKENNKSIRTMCLVDQSCPTLCDLMDCSPPGSSVHGDFLGKNIGVGCHALLQGTFPTQRLNPGLPHCRWILYWVSYHTHTHILLMCVCKKWKC